MMTNFKTAAALFLLLIFLMSCATIPEKYPGEVAAENKNMILESYTQSWLEKDLYPYDRQLIHLGLPGPKSVVLWYVLGKQDLQQVIQPQVELCEEESIDQECEYRIYDDIQLVHLSEYGTGRITVRGLKPERTYRGRVRLLDKAVEFTARTAPSPGEQKPFSFIAYSGFQPYVWPDRSQHPYVDRQTVRILEILKERAQTTGDAEDDEATRPAFTLGVGDQVYVDNDAAFEKPSALLWGLHSDQIRCSDADLTECFDEVYRRHFAIPPLDEAFRYLPSAMIWDDHEIRDGWGSQGDEKEKINGIFKWGNYLNQARGAFVAYQALRNPGLGDFKHPEPGISIWDRINRDAGTKDWIKDEVIYTEDPTTGKELFFRFDWGSASFFVMDLRSYRYVNEKRVISATQFEAIEAWLKEMESAESPTPKLLVLVSTMPLAAGRPEASEFFAKALDRELADDLGDKWASVANIEQRQKLLCMLADFLERNKTTHQLLVIGGDIHASEVTYWNTGDPDEVVAHEVVASGLAQTKFDKRGTIYGMVNRTHECDETSQYESLTTEKIEGPNFVEIYVDPRGAETSEEIDVRVRFYLASINGRFVRSKPNPNTGRRTIPLAEKTPELEPHIDIGSGFRDLILSTINPGDRETYQVTTLRDYFEYENTSEEKVGEEKAASWYDPDYPPPSAGPFPQAGEAQQPAPIDVEQEVQVQE